MWAHRRFSPEERRPSASSFIGDAHQLAPIKEQDDETLKRRKESEKIRGKSSSSLTSGNTNRGPDEAKRQDDTLQKLSDYMFSRQHLQSVLEDPHLARQLGAHICSNDPSSLYLLKRMRNLSKALQSIYHAQAILDQLEDHESQIESPIAGKVGMPWVLQEKMEGTLADLAAGAFRSFLTDLYRRAVIRALGDQVSGRSNRSAQDLEDAGLAEAFVLADPTKSDNPVTFTSDESVPSLRTPCHSKIWVLGVQYRLPSAQFAIGLALS